MNIQKYTAFLKVAEYHSISRAAREIGYTQSAVSKMLLELEAEWNVRLFTRNHDGVELTAEGREIHDDVQRICHDYERLNSNISALHGIEKGTIRLGAPASISTNLLPRILKSFHEKYPHIRVALYEGEYSEIDDSLRRGIIDVCILPEPYSDKYISKTVHKDSLVAVLPPDHPLATSDFVPVHIFELEEVINLREVIDYDIAGFLDENKIHPNFVYEVSHDYTMFSMVESGLGVCIDYELMLQPLRHNVIVKPMSRTKKRTLKLCIKDEASRTPLINLFFDQVKETSAYTPEPPLMI